MRDTLEKQRAENKEITVKTARGEEFKFGGISEKFTKKLYEWEQQKNIAPELSTIALLDTSINQDECKLNQSGKKKLSSDGHKGQLLIFLLSDW